jgi:hypothetical protein
MAGDRFCFDRDALRIVRHDLQFSGESLDRVGDRSIFNHDALSILLGLAAIVTHKVEVLADSGCYLPQGSEFFGGEGIFALLQASNPAIALGFGFLIRSVLLRDDCIEVASAFLGGLQIFRAPARFWVIACAMPLASKHEVSSPSSRS